MSLFLSNCDRYHLCMPLLMAFFLLRIDSVFNISLINDLWFYLFHCITIAQQIDKISAPRTSVLFGGGYTLPDKYF